MVINYIKRFINREADNFLTTKHSFGSIDKRQNHRHNLNSLSKENK